MKNAVGPKTSNADKKKFGPESEFLHALKGKTVRLLLNHPQESELVGRLVWVDRYSLCIQTERGRVVVKFKSGIAGIEEHEYDKKPGDEKIDERHRQTASATT